MDWFLKLGFFSMADKVTNAIGGALPYIITGSVIVAIWIYFLFLVPKKEKRYDRVSDYLNDILNFRQMLSSGLAKILYISFAIVVFIVGLVAIFAANFLVGLLGTLILEIILRVIFEVIMVVFSIQENVTAIREKQSENESQYYYDDED